MAILLKLIARTCPSQLVRCLSGAIFDVAVDLRAGSVDHGRWAGLVLSADAGNQLLIPGGFSHGFCTLAADARVCYKVSAPYSAPHDKGLAWDDATVGVDWPDIASPDTLSSKDRAQPALHELPPLFHHGGPVMRVMVTGGAGFIGSAMVRDLVIDKGADVLTVDALTYAGNLASLRAVEGCANHRFVNADVCDRDAMDRACGDFRPDRIMHLAAESHVDRSITGSRAFIETNVVGTYTLLEAARCHWEALDAEGRTEFRFLHVSTDEVYGALGPQGLFREDTPYDPSSPYSATKAASDHLAKAWHRTFGFPVVVFNCSNNYGPYHFPEKLIPLIILNALQRRPLPVYGNNVRDWLFVNDHARALDIIAERGRPGETCNVGGRNELRNMDVVR